MPGAAEGGPVTVPRTETLEKSAKGAEMAFAGSGAMDMQAPLAGHVVKGIGQGPGAYGRPRPSNASRVTVAGGVSSDPTVTPAAGPSATTPASRCPSSAGAATAVTGVAVNAMLSAARAQSVR